MLIVKFTEKHLSCSLQPSKISNGVIIPGGSMEFTHEQYLEWKKHELWVQYEEKQKLGLWWGETEGGMSRTLLQDTKGKWIGVIDFERGDITVKVRIGVKESLNSIRVRLAEVVEYVITYKYPAGGYLLRGQLVDKKSRIIEGGLIHEFALMVTEEAVIDNCMAGRVASITFRLSSDNIRKRMSLFSHSVRCFCNEYEIDPILLNSLIHVETRCNPVAFQAGCKAGLLGLEMQTGARYGYHFVYGRDRIPSPEILFDPDKSIEIGCAYLYLLQKRYFQDIPDYGAVMLCTIAAFGCSPHRLALCFAGNNGMVEAIRVIRSLGCAEAVYRHLMSHLPLTVDKLYIKRVIDTMRLYSSNFHSAILCKNVP